MDKFKIIESRFIKNLKMYSFDSKNESINNFENLWHTKKDYFKHLEKRINKEKIVKNEFDYILKTFETLYTGEVYHEVFPQNSIWDRVFYSQKNRWAVVVGENGKILTSYQVQKTIQNTFQKHKEIFDVKVKKMEVSNEFKREIEKITNKLRKF